MITRLVTPEDKGIKILQNVSIYQLTRRNIPNDMKLQRRYCRNLKPHNDLCKVQLCSEPLTTALQSVAFSQFAKTLLNQHGKVLLQKTNCSVNHGIPCLLENLQVHYHIHKISQPSMQMQTFCVIKSCKLFKREKLCKLQYSLHPLSHSTIFLSIPFSSTLKLCTFIRLSDLVPYSH